MYPFLLLINRCNLFQGPSDAQFFWGEAAVPDGCASVADVQEATVSQEQQPWQSDWWGSAEAVQVSFASFFSKQVCVAAPQLCIPSVEGTSCSQHQGSICSLRRARHSAEATAGTRCWVCPCSLLFSRNKNRDLLCTGTCDCAGLVCLQHIREHVNGISGARAAFWFHSPEVSFTNLSKLPMLEPCAAAVGLYHAAPTALRAAQSPAGSAGCVRMWGCVELRGLRALPAVLQHHLQQCASYLTFVQKML